MVMGLKKTSDVIAISFGVDETAPNTFVQEEIALQLDVLNNEIAVVLAIDLDVTAPDAIAATDTITNASLSTTTLTAVGNLSQSNVLAQSQDRIMASGFVDGGVGFSRKADSTYPATLDAIGYIATNNFFVQLQGGNNVNPKSMTGRLWFYRARADATTYAALVQSEVLSS